MSGFRSTPMVFKLFDSDENLRGEFVSIYDLEIYVDGVRNSRGESYPQTPRMSPFDYIKSIGWIWTIDETVDEVAHSTL